MLLRFGAEGRRNAGGVSGGWSVRNFATKDRSGEEVGMDSAATTESSECGAVRAVSSVGCDAMGEETGTVVRRVVWITKLDGLSREMCFPKSWCVSSQLLIVFTNAPDATTATTLLPSAVSDSASVSDIWRRFEGLCRNLVLGTAVVG